MNLRFRQESRTSPEKRLERYKHYVERKKEQAAGN
jgi:hypothetical protein